MYSERSPSRAPASRKCKATVVLPVPGSPSSKNTWPRDNPPSSMSSSPSIPVAAFGLIDSLDVDKKMPSLDQGNVAAGAWPKMGCFVT
ncbi:hypothetical protein D3C76_1525960 [compost metagenome]